MKRSSLALLLVAALFFVCGCKPSDECECTRVINGQVVNETWPLDKFVSCQELADDREALLGKEVDCF